MNKFFGAVFQFLFFTTIIMIVVFYIFALTRPVQAVIDQYQ